MSGKVCGEEGVWPSLPSVSTRKAPRCQQATTPCSRAPVWGLAEVLIQCICQGGNLRLNILAVNFDLYTMKYGNHCNFALRCGGEHGWGGGKNEKDVTVNR